MLGDDGEQRSGFLRTTSLGSRAIEKGASLDHIVARVQQKNGPWVWRLGAQENSLPTKCLDVVRPALVDAKETGELSRGARVGGTPATGAGKAANRRDSARRWWGPALGTTVDFSCSHAQLLTSPARRSRVNSATTEPSAWFILPDQGHEAISWLVRSSGRAYGLSRPRTTHNPLCYTQP
jgi:hypothetical protein